MTASSYDKHPVIRTGIDGGVLSVGWNDILERVRGEVSRGARTIAVECYSGVFTGDVRHAFTQWGAAWTVFDTETVFKSSSDIERLVSRDLTDDPVFGRINGLTFEDFVDRHSVSELRSQVHDGRPVVVIGTGATLVVPEPDLLIYANLPRWEIQKRQRAGRLGNLGVENQQERPSLKYKRAFFVDWRVADRIKKALLGKLDYLLDTTDEKLPKMVTGDAYRAGLKSLTRRPFRVVPFFDPGPWGGQWMRDVCGLPSGEPNYAWCFDCVPEENSLLLEYGSSTIEVPAIDLVFQHPRELLGDPVHARFGTEFPIRFDFLDTMEGGNLSLQVHPLTEYIQDKFGMAYTQDESYYMLDAAPGACVYLGLKPAANRDAMRQELYAAQAGGAPFDALKYVNQWPARKHDHFLIPAGTVHCSGRNSMVLEISATPYIFTFKMWDWGRLGLDGRPRPIHLEHALANVQWDRDTEWTRANLVNRLEPVAAGPGWREERTGLHEREFIETRRHWFEKPVTHMNSGGVHVLNLVEGREAVVDSPAHSFDPFVVRYAETFIVPANVGSYRISPLDPAGPCATVRASVRF